MKEFLREGETWDDLVRNQMGIIQPVSGYRFGMDSVLLAHFAAQAPAHTILDLGTGCGVIALLLAARLPEAMVAGVEIQHEQAERALRSVQANKLVDRVQIIIGDLKDGTILEHGHYDLVTANPPFFVKGRGRLPADESVAVSRHEIKCSLADIFVTAARCLIANGRFCLILPPNRHQEALQLATGAKFRLVRMRAVYPRDEQPANLLLMEFKKMPVVSELVIEPPLVVYQADGSYTSTIMDIYFGP